MSQPDPIILLAGSFFIVFFGFLLTALSLKKKKDFLQKQLTETGNSLEQAKEELHELRKKHDKILQFQNSLAAAELTTQLQRPRLSAQTSATDNQPPEKYRLVHSLAKKNMSIDEIASFLAISCHEAQQLVTLAKLAH